MNVRYISNIVLALLIIGLYYLLNKPVVEPLVNKSVSTLTANMINSIVINRHGRDEVQLEKEHDHWQVKQPIPAPANAIRIKLILDLLSSAPQSQFTVTDKMDLQEFGLEPAAITLQLNQQQFKFGKIESLSKHRYLQHNGIIYLVDDKLMPLLNASAASFIDNQIIAKNLKITQIQLPSNSKISDPSPIIIKTENGHWVSNRESIPTDTLVALIDAWQHSYALQVIPLTKQERLMLTGEKIIIHFNNQTALELLLQFNQHNFSLIDLDKQLKYQFPISIKQQLFINKATD